MRGSVRVTHLVVGDGLQPDLRGISDRSRGEDSKTYIHALPAQLQPSVCPQHEQDSRHKLVLSKDAAPPFLVELRGDAVVAQMQKLPVCGFRT